MLNEKIVTGVHHQIEFLNSIIQLRNKENKLLREEIELLVKQIEYLQVKPLEKISQQPAIKALPVQKPLEVIKPVIQPIQVKPIEVKIVPDKTKQNDLEVIDPVIQPIQVKPIKVKIVPDKTKQNEIHVYTDGSFQNKIGGWAFALIQNNKVSHKAFGGELCDSNNTMELMAVVKAFEYLKTLPSSDVSIYSDSKSYVIHNALENLKKWENDWRLCKQNQPLWEKINQEAKKHTNVKWNWVQAHVGHEYNGLVDNLALQGRIAHEKTCQP